VNAPQHSQYVIIGAGAAGMAAAHAIRRIDKGGGITVLSQESDTPYFRPMIPYLVSNQKRPNQMAMAGHGPFDQPNIDILTNTKVVAVDSANRQIALAGGGRMGYEKVLFATGSRPYVPPEINGIDTPGVFAPRTLADARAMAARAARTRQAVMLGGGLLNLKTAFALLKRGIAVTLVVHSPEVLSQLMDPADAALIRKALIDAGLVIQTGVAATDIQADPAGVVGVALSDGSHLSCQMISIGKGVRPCVDFLQRSGIQIADGIVTDRHTACNMPNAFAAGDVAVSFDPVSGRPMSTALWTHAIEMGRCAGLNMVGVKTAYSGTFGILNATQVADLPFVSMGTVHTAGQDYEIHRKSSANTYHKLVFDAEGTRLIGAVLVGDITHAGLYRSLIRDQMDITGRKRHIIDRSLHYGHFIGNAKFT